MTVFLLRGFFGILKVYGGAGRSCLKCISLFVGPFAWS